ncbi:MAG TPA: hypothetical protein VGN69_08795 [Solirubrobacteraceae bacterium]|jgi:hypothetical protein|nr:hypothetical protein [Solirubrobacteraceae bacterium]
MTPRPIVTSHAAVNCDVCGRTLLRGELADVFLTGGSRRTVCELCVARAAHEGWIREGVDDSLGVRPRADRGRSLLGRLRQRREAAGGSLVGLERDAATGNGGTPSPVRESSVPAEAAREPRSVRAVPTNADLKTSRALDVFNASEHPRTVAGVARSLGTPFVVVRPAEAAGSVVLIVVGWELCWYRYEVDLADEASGVRLVAKGDEIADLPDSDRLPNAAADEYGELVAVAG